MISISYLTVAILVAAIWLVSRCTLILLRKRFSLYHEFRIMLVFICIAVVLRFTFFAFRLHNGQIQPLVIDLSNVYPFRINLAPLIYLFDYDGSVRDALINVIGNTAMFIPIGIILPLTYPKLDRFKNVVLAGFLASLCIELMQLPIASRVSDVDDLLLNTLGCGIGYAIYIGVRKVTKLKGRK